ncbi:hypothetical protein OIDMADRAFT_17410 [Oidiodendron maius Zn]|uniref:Uncharacterized protein n=1 Tax=Oidiodendron maius (strain Zn) TaxID=913774 RepID=A0A0C3HUG8_OIDMZ|nr:hypothetical protein OIDMADRAFT_17410 [Oidiodendron maius Zn]
MSCTAKVLGGGVDRPRHVDPFANALVVVVVGSLASSIFAIGRGILRGGPVHCQNSDGLISRAGCPAPPIRVSTLGVCARESRSALFLTTIIM